MKLIIFLLSVFSCLLWHFFTAALSHTKSPDVKSTSERWEFRHSGEPSIVLFGFPEWFSEWFVVTRRRNVYDVCFSLMVYWEPDTASPLSLSLQEAEWHCDEFTKGACFSRGKSEVSLSDAGASEMSHWYIALSRCWGKQGSVLVLLKK